MSDDACGHEVLRLVMISDADESYTYECVACGARASVSIASHVDSLAQAKDEFDRKTRLLILAGRAAVRA